MGGRGRAPLGITLRIVVPRLTLRDGRLGHLSLPHRLRVLLVRLEALSLLLLLGEADLLRVGQLAGRLGGDRLNAVVVALAHLRLTRALALELLLAGRPLRGEVLLRPVLPPLRRLKDVLHGLARAGRELVVEFALRQGLVRPRAPGFADDIFRARRRGGC